MAQVDPLMERIAHRWYASRVVARLVCRRHLAREEIIHCRGCHSRAQSRYREWAERSHKWNRYRWKHGGHEIVGDRETVYCWIKISELDSHFCSPLVCDSVN